MDNVFLNEQRCACGKLLLKGIFFDGALEIKCGRCGQINKIGSIKSANDNNAYLLIVDNRGLIVNTSDSVSRFLGYTRTELIGQHFTFINPTIPRDMDQKFFGPESVLEKDNYLQLDTTHQAKNGMKIPVTIFLKLYFPTNQEDYVLVIVKLRSTSKGSDAPAQAGPQFLENGCDFHFLLDRNGIFQYVNPALEKLFGFPSEMIVGKSYFDYVSPEKLTESLKNFAYFLGREEPYRIKSATAIAADGRKIQSELYFTPNFNDFGKFSGYCVLGWVVEE
jgi:PAS domain S-box-containing protein